MLNHSSEKTLNSFSDSLNQGEMMDSDFKKAEDDDWNEPEGDGEEQPDEDEVEEEYEEE